MSARLPAQVVAFDDCSTDDSLSKLAEWKARIDRLDGMACVVLSGAAQGQTRARGAGFGRNRCVEASSGSVLAMLDSDDAMEPRRLELQLELLLAEEAKGGAVALPVSAWGPGEAAAASATAPAPQPGAAANGASSSSSSSSSAPCAAASDDARAASPPLVLVGAQVTRVPAGSTAKYTAWINEMPAAELWLQQYREVTLVQPTWMLRRAAFLAAGGYGVEALPPSEAPSAAAAEAAAAGAIHRPFPTRACIDPGLCLPGAVRAASLRVLCAGIAAFNRFAAAHFDTRLKEAAAPAGAGRRARGRKQRKRGRPGPEGEPESKRAASGDEAGPAQAPPPAAADAAAADAAAADAGGVKLAAAVQAAADTAGASGGGSAPGPTGTAGDAAATPAAGSVGANAGAGAGTGTGAAAALRKRSARVQFPEDLLFVHCLWAAGGRPARVDEPLVRYRCTPGSVSWNIPRRALLAVKAAAFEVRELGLPGPLGAEGVGGGHGWEQLTPESQARAVECAARAAAEAAAPARPLAGGFSVWSAGRDGSQFMASLSPEALALVRCAGDVDPKKIEARFVAVTPGFQPGAAVVKVPVIPVAEMEAPVVTCVVLTSGSEFEKGLGAWMRARGALRGADVIHMA